MNKAKKRNKLGRPRKLTAAELRKGVEAYFASISYLEPVEAEEFVVLSRDEETGAVTYALDEMGHRLTRPVPVLGADGKQLMRLRYITPPGDYGLCDFLHISYDTWQRYGKLGSGEKAASRDGTESRDATSSGPAGHLLPVKGTMPSKGKALGDGRGDPAPTGCGGDSEEALYAEVYALARGRICAYLESAAETKGGAGARFKLERIYGLTEQKQIDVGGSTIEEYLRRLGGGAEY